MAKETEADFLSFDLHSLETEWASQVRLMGKYTKLKADATKKAAEAKAAFKLAESELLLYISSDPSAYGLEKSTDTIVKACVATQKQYKLSQQEMINADHLVDMLDGAVKTLEHRKKALEDEVFLWSRDYFSSPRASGEAKRSMEAAAADITVSRINSKLKKRKTDD